MQQKQAAHAVSLYLDIDQASMFNTPLISSPVTTINIAELSSSSAQTKLMPLRYKTEISKAKAPVQYSSANKSPAGRVPLLVAEPPNEALKRSQEPTMVPLSPTISPDNVQPITGASWVIQFTRLVLLKKSRCGTIPQKPLKPIGIGCGNSKRIPRSKPPESLSTTDVKEFLTWLAVKKEVAASTQNQAFNALLFFYRYVLQKEFGKVEGVVRAKHRPYIPVVLCREEIEAIFSHLAPPVNLVVKLLYVAACVCSSVSIFASNA